jgi:hypothetical protein
MFKRWVQVWYIWYIIRTFVNATMYSHLIYYIYSSVTRKQISGQDISRAWVWAYMGLRVCGLSWENWGIFMIIVSYLWTKEGMVLKQVINKLVWKVSFCPGN